jgi:ligand-binding SRPBCC domain-containing protein
MILAKPFSSSTYIGPKILMTTYQLVREQTVSLSLDEVFAFFADARNLETLTPPWLKFEILTPGEIPMQAGAIIQYALRFRGVPIHWTTSITVWNPPFEFVDVQLSGPYVLWHHRHTFESVGTNTKMIDEVHYRLPFGKIGNMVHALIVRRDLQRIFDFRKKVIEDTFRKVQSADVTIA